MIEHSQQAPAQTFTITLQEIFSAAQSQTRALKHRGLGPEHLLLGILQPDQHFNLATHFLVTALAEQANDLYPELQANLRASDNPTKNFPMIHILRPDTLVVLTHMFKEASLLQQTFINSLHLLYGILEEQDNPGARLLEKYGISQEQIHLTLGLMSEPMEPLSPNNSIFLSLPRETRGYRLSENVPGEAVAPSRFDKFSPQSRQVLAWAQEEAIHFKHNYIGTEHLLLGIVHDPSNIASQILHTLGIEPHKVREAIHFILGKGDREITEAAGLTPRAKKVIELAVEEARKMGHHYIGTEHLLLGITREGEGIAAGVLNSLGADEAKIRNITMDVLGNASRESEIKQTTTSPHTGETSDKQNVEKQEDQAGPGNDKSIV